MAKKFIPKTPYLSADCIILNKKNEILLIKRTIEPCIGSWVLPGGLVEIGETTESAAIREAEEETGLKVKNPKLVGVYSDPKRDSRYHCVNVTYFFQSYRGTVKGNYESSEQKFFSLNKLPKKMGFDHLKIINDYKKWQKKF